MNNHQDLLDALEINFSDPDLLTQALTHRSYLNENPKSKTSNERLEFLGDSVLSLLTSTELFRRFPEAPEGKLTSIRSSLVRTETLAKLAKALKLGEHLLLSRGEEKSGGRNNTSLLADTFEAVLGAIYLDQGLDQTQKLLAKHLFPLIKSISADKAIFDYKSHLQEITQRQNKVSPVYKVLSQEGPDHDKTFTVGVFLNSTLFSQARGKSKQEAEQNAAQIALDREKH